MRTGTDLDPVQTLALRPDPASCPGCRIFVIAEGVEFISDGLAWAANGTAAAAAAVAGLKAGNTCYVMSTFSEPDLTLRVLVSQDGALFKPSTQNGVSLAGPVRDPSIIRMADGRFAVVHTLDPNASTQFGVAISTDLISWTDKHLIGGFPATTTHVWAPEWVVDSDGGLHVFVAVDYQEPYRFSIFEIHPTNSDLSAWSSPILISGTLDKIDPCVVRDDGGVYHLFCAGYNWGHEFVEHMTASSLLGPYTLAGQGDWATFGCEAEGASVIRCNGKWRVYFDRHPTGVNQFTHYYSEADSLSGPWSEPVEMLNQQISPRHGTVLVVSDMVVSTALLTQTVTNPVGAFHADKTQPGVGVLRLVKDDDGSAWDFTATRHYSPPLLISATIQPNGVTWTLKFDTPVTASVWTGWTVEMLGVAVTLTYSSGDVSDTLTYAGNRAVASGEPPTAGLSYTHPANGIASYNGGGALANITNAWVRNKSTQ